MKHLITAVDEKGNLLHVEGLKGHEHRQTMRRLRRRMQRQRDAALRDGRARFTSQRLRSGRVKHRFRWTDGPSKSYLKVLSQLRRIEQKRQDSLAGIQHRITSQLVRDHQILAIEDTRIRNMVRSARGTSENPGSNVRQKAGLNRSILFQDWYGIRLKLEYKCRWYGRTLIPVEARNTSRFCTQCGSVNPGNRKTQSRFHCKDCGHTANADVNAAENIRRQGLTLLAREENGSSEPPGRAAGIPQGKQAHRSGATATADAA